jgi:hypothetical protein
MKQNSLLDQLRRVLSILLNLAVVRMEPIAIRMSWEAVGEQSLTFYTENSNLFSAAVCLLVAVCQLWALLSGRALPRWVKRLKFIAACCLTLTFLTVVFVLAPYYPDEGGVVFLLTESSMLYHHLLNPVLVFVSFVFLEREPRLPANHERTDTPHDCPNFSSGRSAHSLGARVPDRSIPRPHRRARC